MQDHDAILMKPSNNEFQILDVLVVEKPWSRFQKRWIRVWGSFLQPPELSIAKHEYEAFLKLNRKNINDNDQLIRWGPSIERPVTASSAPDVLGKRHPTLHCIIWKLNYARKSSKPFRYLFSALFYVILLSVAWHCVGWMAEIIETWNLRVLWSEWFWYQRLCK